MAKRNLYLDTKPVDEADALYRAALQRVLKVEYETVPVAQALNRVTKEAAYAKYCSPLFNASAMDGIAVISQRTKTATEAEPVLLHETEDYMVVDTGVLSGQAGPRPCDLADTKGAYVYLLPLHSL